MKKILLFTTIIVLFSCNSSDEIAPINDRPEEVNPEEDKNLKLLSITTYDADNSQLEYRVEYKYIDNKLFEIKQSSNSSNSPYVTHFQYDPTFTKILNIAHFSNDQVSSTETFYFENSKIVSVEYNYFNEIKENANFIYTGNNISKKEVYYGDLIYSISNFTYDTNDNLLRLLTNTNIENEMILTYDNSSEYDDKKNPLNLVYTESLKKVLFIGKNNVILEKGILRGNQISVKNEYTYNEKGYPMSVKVYRDGVHISNQYYVYAKN